jgi:hypothetical protein
MLTLSPTALEIGSPEGQVHLSKTFNKSEFNVGLERMIAYWRTKGGLGSLLIPERKEGHG